MDEKELKEIEEMQNDIVKSVSYDGWSSRKYGQPVIDFYETAENLHKLCYRKVPEGTVVISKEEYDGLKKQVHALEHLATCYSEQIDWDNDARKETARGILQRLYDTCYDRQKAIGGVECDVLPIDILALAKEYGVKVEYLKWLDWR